MSAPSRRVLVIWNPKAGGGDPETTADRRSSIRDALAEHGIQAEIYESPSEEAANARIDRALDEGFDAVVAAGGDGTVQSVAARLLDRRVALGILPVGTAMNTARALGVPMDLRGAAAALASGDTRPMDAGEARGRMFLGVLSVGLGAEVLGGAARATKGRPGAIRQLLRRAWQYRRTRVCIRLDDQEVRTRAVSVAVANGRFIGHRLELAPRAQLDDGQFDILVFDFGGPRLLLHLARSLLGGTVDPRIRRFRAGAVRISSHRPMAVRADAMDLGVTPVEVVVRRAALRVIAPNPAS